MSVLAIIVAVLLAGLLASGVALIARSRRAATGHPACGRCRYDVTGSLGATDRCPECGAAFAEVGIMPPKGRRDPMLLGIGMVMVALVVAAAGAGIMGLLVQRAEAARALAQRQRAMLQIQVANQALRQGQPPAVTLPPEQPPDLEDAGGDEQADDGQQDGGG